MTNKKPIKKQNSQATYNEMLMVVSFMKKEGTTQLLQASEVLRCYSLFIHIFKMPIFLFK